MIEIVIFSILIGGFLYYKYKEQKRDEEHREQTFRMTMLALEEKAKKEGTFKVSYFDKGE